HERGGALARGREAERHRRSGQEIPAIARERELDAVAGRERGATIALGLAGDGRRLLAHGEEAAPPAHAMEDLAAFGAAHDKKRYGPHRVRLQRLVAHRHGDRAVAWDRVGQVVEVVLLEGLRDAPRETLCL